jgi:hypothetical protein
MYKVAELQTRLWDVVNKKKLLTLPENPGNQKA